MFYPKVLCENDINTINNLNDSDWLILSSLQKFSEDFMRKYADKLNWVCILSNFIPTEKFMIENFNRLDSNDWCGVWYGWKEVRKRYRPEDFTKDTPEDFVKSLMESNTKDIFRDNTKDFSEDFIKKIKGII